MTSSVVKHALGTTCPMADSLLIEALDQARAIVDDLRTEDPLAGHELRLRAALLERSAAIMRLRPPTRDDVVRLAKLAMELRDDAVALRTTYRHPRSLVAAMID